MRSYKKLKYAVVCVIGLGGGSLVWAEPVVVEGVVPNEASKQAILMRMQSVYGANQVIDKIQVRPVAAPNGWSDSVAVSYTHLTLPTNREV